MTEQSPRVDQERLPPFDKTMKRLQDGDEDMWSRVYNKFNLRMKKAAKRLVGIDAEVVVQEVWAKLVRRFGEPEFDPLLSFR